MPTLLLALVFLLAPVLSFASPAVSCHCFKDREYDPARPAATDPYVQATARNSLLSAAFGIDKGQVVRKLMTGAVPDDLWIAYWTAAKTGADSDQLLASKGGKGSWKAVLAGVDTARLGAAFTRLVASGVPDAALAAWAVDDVLVARIHADPATIKGLRGDGAASHDVILCLLLAPRARLVPADVYAQVKGGKKSWGALLQGLGLTPKEVDPEIRRAIR